MLDQPTLTYILGIIALFSTAFIIYNKIRNPQFKIEKKQAVADKEAESKAHILTQKLQWEKESNERRFNQITDNLTTSNTNTTNHLNHIDAKVDGLVTIVNNINGELIKLTTIIEERIPKSK